MAADETADAVAISGLGTNESIEKAIHECSKQGIYSILDMMNVQDIPAKLEQLKLKPNIVLLHRNIDSETMNDNDNEQQSEWGNIRDIKSKLNERGLIAVAGGVTPEKVNTALDNGADIIIAGRYSIGSSDVRRAADDFLRNMPQDSDTMRVALDEDEKI